MPLFISSPREKRCRKACLCPPPHGKCHYNSICPFPRWGNVNDNLICPFPRWGNVNDNLICPFPRWGNVNDNSICPFPRWGSAITMLFAFFPGGDHFNKFGDSEIEFNHYLGIETLMYILSCQTGLHPDLSIGTKQKGQGSNIFADGCPRFMPFPEKKLTRR